MRETVKAKFPVSNSEGSVAKKMMMIAETRKTIVQKLMHEATNDEEEQA
jgi:hypothetical protein